MTSSLVTLMRSWRHWDAATVFRVHLISRQVITILLTWVLARSELSLEEIGTYEMLHLLGYALTFFWLDASLKGYMKVFRDIPSPERPLFTRQIAGTLALLSLSFFFLGLVLTTLPSGLSALALPESRSWVMFGIFYFSFHISSMVEVVYLQEERPISLGRWSVVSGIAQLAFLGLPVMLTGSLLAGLTGLAGFGLLRSLVFLRICRPRWPSTKGAFRLWRSVSWPLALSGLIGGSAVLIDGFVIMAFFPEGGDYAIYRYGARELPFAILLASGLEWVLLDRLSGQKTPDVGQAKRFASKWLTRLMPLAVLAMLFSGPVFVGIYGERFAESAGIFRIYLLLLLSRFVLSGPLLTALGDTRAILTIGVMEALLNLALSWWWAGLWGPVGVAWATVAAFFFDKAAQLIRLRSRFGIPPSDVVSPRQILVFAALLLLVYWLAPWVPSLWSE